MKLIRPDRIPTVMATDSTIDSPLFFGESMMPVSSSSQIRAAGQIDAMGIDVGFFSTKFTLGRLPAASGRVISVDQFPSHAELMAGGMQQLPMTKRLDGMSIEVDGVPYFVGKDVLHVVRGHATRAVSQDYSTTTAYRALFLGALAYSAQNAGVKDHLTIKHLVVGLPVSTIYTGAERLRRQSQGEHLVQLPGTDTRVKVVVQNVTVVAQPQGALVAVGGSRLARNPKDTTLVLDMGGGTFDWFVSEGMKPNHQRCGAAPIGMLACATAVCDQIKPDLRSDPKILARVDEALRLDSATVRITGRDHELAPYMPTVMKVLENALEPMLKSVESLENIDSIILTGGGAPMLAKAIATRMRDYTHTIQVDTEPVASNARGFHMIAEKMNGSQS